MSNEAGKYKKQKGIFNKYIKPAGKFANKWIVDPLMTYTLVGKGFRLANKGLEAIGNAGGWVADKLDSYRKEQEALPTFKGSASDWGTWVLKGLGSGLRLFNWPRKYINQLCAKYKTSIILSDTQVSKKSTITYKGEMKKERDAIKFNIGEGKQGPHIILALEDEEPSLGKAIPVDINNPNATESLKDTLIQCPEGSNILYLIFKGCEISDAKIVEGDISSISYVYKYKDTSTPKRIFFPTRKIQRIKVKKEENSNETMLKIYLKSISRRLNWDRDLSDD